MSGHSKWHTIKHKKGAADAKRGKVFTRIIKELTVAARAGGGDPDSNPRLRTIIADAKAANMPAENIKRAIRRGTGEEPGVTYEEVMYEGYGPGGAAIILETLTDNKNRTVGEIRHLLDKHNGKLGDRNSVARLFTKRGQVVVEKSKYLSLIAVLTLLATFALVLVINDATLYLWGPEDLLGPRAPGLRGALPVLGRQLPSYDLFLIFIGPLVLLALHFTLARTRFGRLVRAATQDRDMVAALGVNQKWLFTSVFAVGVFLPRISHAPRTSSTSASACKAPWRANSGVGVIKALIVGLRRSI